MIVYDFHIDLNTYNVAIWLLQKSIQMNSQYQMANYEHCEQLETKKGTNYCKCRLSHHNLVIMTSRHRQTWQISSANKKVELECTEACKKTVPHQNNNQMLRVPYTLSPKQNTILTCG